MGLVVNALTKFAKSSVGSELYRWGTSEAGKMFLCTKMPLIETGLATASRVYATEKQDLSRREKNVLQAGHIVPAIFGISIGSVLNKKVYNLADKVVKNDEWGFLSIVNENNAEIKIPCHYVDV